MEPRTNGRLLDYGRSERQLAKTLVYFDMATFVTVKTLQYRLLDPMIFNVVS
jgi:hypothetical protein